MDCSVLDEIFMDDWSLNLLEQLKGKRYPLGGMIELTDRCNLGCVHCYINQPLGNREAMTNELTTNEIKNILDQLAEAGTLFITFTGGEVLVRRDFIEIYHYARRLGMVVTIFTNGTMLTRQIADELAGSRPRVIEITLYGATQETYEKITGVPGSFDRCMQGINLLLERKINLNLKTMILSINLHELPAMRTFAEERGLSFLYGDMIWPRLNGADKPYQHRLTPEQVIALDNSDPERRAALKGLADSFQGQKIRAEYVYNCGAAIHSYHIDSAGRMSSCGMARFPFFDLRKMSFAEAWERIAEVRTQKRVTQSICQDCTLGVLCEQCPGWSQSVHGDDETPVQYLCEVAHLRANNL